MKAIQLCQPGSFDHLRLVEVDTPTPGRGQVLVRVQAASVNFADTMLRKGTYPVMPSLPVIPGLEASGVVELVGDGVTSVSRGQQVIVIATNCYADYVVTEAASAFAIPKGIDLEEAATLPVAYGTAYHLLHTMARIEPRHTLVIRAPAGGVGTAVIQLTKRVGATVIGLTSTQEKVNYATQQGCDYVINYRVDSVMETVRDITKGRGADFVLNSVAGDTFKQDFEMLGHFGQVLWFGFAEGPPRGTIVEDLSAHLGRSVGIRFFSLSSILESDPASLENSVNALLQDLKEGRIRPQIDTRLPLAEAARAHELLESGAVMGKVILKP